MTSLNSPRFTEVSAAAAFVNARKLELRPAYEVANAALVAAEYQFRNEGMRFFGFPSEDRQWNFGHRFGLFEGAFLVQNPERLDGLVATIKRLRETLDMVRAILAFSRPTRDALADAEHVLTATGRIQREIDNELRELDNALVTAEYYREMRFRNHPGYSEPSQPADWAEFRRWALFAVREVATEMALGETEDTALMSLFGPAPDAIVHRSCQPPAPSAPRPRRASLAYHAGSQISEDLLF